MRVQRAKGNSPVVLAVPFAVENAVDAPAICVAAGTIGRTAGPGVSDTKNRRTFCPRPHTTPQNNHKDELFAINCI